MIKKSITNQKITLDEMIENNIDKQNALKKIIQDVERLESLRKKLGDK